MIGLGVDFLLKSHLTFTCKWLFKWIYITTTYLLPLSLAHLLITLEEILNLLHVLVFLAYLKKSEKECCCVNKKSFQQFKREIHLVCYGYFSKTNYF